MTLGCTLRGFLTRETPCTPLPVPADYPDPCQGCRFLAGMGIGHRKVTRGLPVPITTNISLKRKKIGQHVVAGALEAFCKFCIFPQKFNGTQAPIKDMLQGPFWTRTACLPGGKLELEKKFAFSHMIKINSVLRIEISGGIKAGG